jgi:outer membrane immunogenic protein
LLGGANLKKLLLASSALVIALGGQASAGPPPPPTYLPKITYEWTGFYIGGHVGAGWDRTNFSDPGAIVPFFGQVQSIAPLGSSIDVDAGGGFLGGIQGGYDWRLGDRWVVGINGTYSWANINGFRRDPFFDGKNGAGIRMNTRTDTLASLTGRFGYVWHDILFYGTGGVGWTHNEYNFQNLSALGNMICGFGCDATGSTNRTGWVGGFGGEWQFSGNWSAFLEYNHFGFGSRDVRFFSPDVPGADAVFHVKQDIDVVRFGFNYRIHRDFPY